MGYEAESAVMETDSAKYPTDLTQSPEVTKIYSETLGELVLLEDSRMMDLESSHGEWQIEVRRQ